MPVFVLYFDGVMLHTVRIYKMLFINLYPLGIKHGLLEHPRGIPHV